ncbi:MAG: hypothetical protein KJT03_20605, partial [Verrucomicrobiae bacterium]|nr:hypothetical protein [Verrucomicrobiae bacterium]
AGPVVALEILIPRIFYSFLLGLGIFISMQRQQSRRGIPPSPGLGRQVQRVWGIAVVWLFFSIIHIWNVEPIQLSFETRSLFFLSLFGLS